MKALEARRTEIGVEHIGAVRATGTGADLVPAYALSLPSQMICELLGVDYADRARFQENTSTALSSTGRDGDPGRRDGGRRDAPSQPGRPAITSGSTT